jgi:DNA-binding transcriptional MocR family regulator
MSERDVIRFTRGVPAIESFPMEDVVAAGTAVLEAHGPTLLQYGPAAGFEPLRAWLAQWRGVPVEQVLTGNGSLQLIDLVCHRLLQPGDLVITEAPTYDRTLTLLRRHRATVVGIPLEADGPRIDALEATLKRRLVPRFLYVIPDFQNPAGTTCSLEKRRALVDLAERYGFWLVEDAPYRPLRYRGEEPPSLYELCPERTLHLLSFSKLIGPGVRVGIAFGPAGLLRELARLAEDTYITPALLGHGIAYEYCRAGRLPGQVERLKALYAPRLQACLDALDTHLPEAETTRPEGGFFVSLTLADGTTAAEVRDRAQLHGLVLAEGRAFFPNGGGERFLRLPYCALTPEEIAEGVRRLASAVRASRAEGSPLVSA